MGARRYEVYGHDGRRWLIDCVREPRSAALMRGDGRERVIHEQAVHRKQASRPRMQTLKDASHCEQLIDY